MSSVSIFTSRRQVEIQIMSEMTPYFTMTKWFSTYLTRSTECYIRTLPSTISTISMTVVKTTLFNMRARCSMKYKM